MYDASRANYLAGLPAHLWADGLQRAKVVEDYLALQRPTLSDAEQSASRLGLSARSFYRLVASFQIARDGPVRVSSKQGLHRSLDERTAKILQNVMSDLPPEARNIDVLAEARARCRRVGVPLPSANAVRVRTGDRPQRGSLLVSLSQDLVLDACPLALDVLLSNSTAAPAVLTAWIHTPTGAILGHHLGGTSPDVSDVAEALSQGLTWGASSGAAPQAEVQLATTSAFPHLPSTLVDALQRCGVQVLDQAALPRANSAVTAAIGRRLGRVPLAPMRRAKSARFERAIPLEEARAAVAALVAKRHDTIAPDAPTSLASLFGLHRSTTLQLSALRLLEEHFDSR